MEAATKKGEEPCAFAKLWGQLDGAPFHCYVTALPSTLGRGSQATEGARKPSGFIDLGRSKALSREHAVISWVPAKKAYQITCMSKNGMVVSGSYHAKGGVEKLESRAPIKLGPASMYFLLPEREAQPAPEPAPSPAPAPAPATVQKPQAPTPPPHAQPTPPPPLPENGSSAVLTPTVRPVAAAAAAAAAVAAPPAAAPAAAAPALPAAHPAAAPAGVPMTVSFGDMVSAAFRSQQLGAIAVVHGLSSGDVQNWIMQAYPEWNQEGARMKALAVGIEETLNRSFVSRGGDRWMATHGDQSAKRARLSSPGSSSGTPTAAVAAAISAAAAAAAFAPPPQPPPPPLAVATNAGGQANNGTGAVDGGGIDVGMTG